MVTGMEGMLRGLGAEGGGGGPGAGGAKRRGRGPGKKTLARQAAGSTGESPPASASSSILEGKQH